MRLKSLTNDQTVPRYRYFNFYKPHKVDGKGFSSQMPTLKIVPSDQKSKRRTCAEECQMPFNCHCGDELRLSMCPLGVLGSKGIVVKCTSAIFFPYGE